MTTKAVRLVAGVAALAAVVAGCGSKPKHDTSSTASPGAAKFSACMVTDTGGIDDHSFNAPSWAGMQAAKKDNRAWRSAMCSRRARTSTSEHSEPGHRELQLIVTVGGLMADATTAASKAHTRQKFAIVDSGSVPPNIQGMQFNTAQGAFLGGYLAAGYRKSGKVGTFGGLPIPPVTIYMDGFWEGVQYYNAEAATHTSRCSAGTRRRSSGSFANSFTDQDAGKRIAQQLHPAGRRRHLPGRRWHRPRRGGGGAAVQRRQGQRHLGGHRRLHVGARSTATCS